MQEGHLVIGSRAKVEGDITAYSVQIAGEVRGLVRVTQHVEILPGGRLLGHAVCERLIMHPGGLYQTEGPAPVIEPPAEPKPMEPEPAQTVRSRSWTGTFQVPKTFRP